MAKSKSTKTQSSDPFKAWDSLLAVRLPKKPNINEWLYVFTLTGQIELAVYLKADMLGAIAALTCRFNDPECDDEMTAKALSSARDEYLEEQTEDVQAVERFRKWLKLTKPLFFRKKKKASGKS